ncbi:hypothetical protein D0T50_11775 [Bacteroides sp. 214]|uniref:DUF6261 family protein n=1 Tax=Bacteroides sp. 214 TaxID=2302935 RepID=UPI0013D53DF0|nr:DUF6261 family protein [Bacteroides sp. 214]NDW13563.1 hypothetical protein [Bacteroides sp. 214]
MKKINMDFRPGYARNAEHFQFQLDVLSAVTTTFATQQKISALRSQYAELVQTENAAYLRNRDYMETPEIEAADKQRDEIFRYIAQIIESNLKCPLEDKKAAAKRLNYYLKPYRNAPELTLAQETAAVTDFVDKMKTEAAPADLSKIGIAGDLDTLKAANDAFNALYTQRSEKVLTRATSETMKTIRPKVDEAYKQLAEAINALYMVNHLVTRSNSTEATIGTVIDDVNSYIAQLQTTLYKAGIAPKPTFGTGEELSPGTDQGDDDFIDPTT